MTERTVKCSICGKPYVVYSYYDGDQSACGSCRPAGTSGSGRTVKCSICGTPYTVYSHYVGDQSACPGCRAEARGLSSDANRGEALWKVG